MKRNPIRLLKLPTIARNAEHKYKSVHLITGFAGNLLGLFCFTGTARRAPRYRVLLRGKMFEERCGVRRR